MEQRPFRPDILRCPATGQRLVCESSGGLVTEDGTRSYPVIHGVPILVVDDEAMFSASEIARSAENSGGGGKQRPGRVGKVFRRPTSLNIGARARYGTFAELVGSAATTLPARVLVVGGGELGEGMERLASSSEIELLETDIYVSERTSIACDAHRLPFPGETFDGVVVQAVLEHVTSPPQVASEIFRVLKHRGLVYAETPFMQQVHEGAFDFTRFTDLGHRRLFRNFAEIDRGIAVGPATALLWSLRYFLRALPRRSRLLALGFDKIVNFGLAWIKYADYLLVDHPGAADAAAGFYFIGRKSDECLNDRTLIKSYRGLVSSVATSRGLQTRGGSTARPN